MQPLGTTNLPMSPTPYPPGGGGRLADGRRWLLVGGLVLAFLLTLGIGTLIGSTIGTVQAATAAVGNVNNTLAGGYGNQGQGLCGNLTVTSVNGQTIVATRGDGTTVTVHTTSTTQYTQAGQAATASAVKAGVQIHVFGTMNSDGSITATRIDVG